ncbi:MAG: hypothetical protein ACREX6_02650 [Casimicrobiaceae bacterium]
MIDALRVTAGWVLVWLLGVAIVAALTQHRRDGGAASVLTRGKASWIAGSGFLAGAFVLTVWMRVLSAAHIRFSVGSVAVPIAAAALALAAVAWRRLRARRDSQPSMITRPDSALAAQVDSSRTTHPDPSPIAHPDSSPTAHSSRSSMTHPASALWWGLAAWLAVRFALLLSEVIWTPLYPWDAWHQWATKARVWYEFGHIVPFVNAGAWFAAHGTAWTDAAPNYPATVPLWQVWSCIALGRWDDSLMNLPWWLTAVALAFSVYGAVRSSGGSALAAMIGAWLVSSLPLANVHVALAGYADLPMAAYYALAALALWRWTQSRRIADATLALLFALACPSIKTPGLVWALTLVPAVLVTLLPRRGPRLVGIGLATVMFALLVLARTHPVVLGYRLHLDFTPAWNGLADSFFLLGNWNLLWYAALACAIVMWRELSVRPMLPLSLTLGIGFLFLAVVFAFTNARDWVSDQTTINRAVLHIAPLATVWVVLLSTRWLESHGILRARAA